MIRVGVALNLSFVKLEDFSLNRPWTYLPSWMNVSDCEYWNNQIKDNLIWEQPIAQVYGKSHIVPRLTTFLAEKTINYKYSGIEHSGNGWPEWFYPLLEMVRSVGQARFNGCLLNLYRNGNDRMGWHSDNEPVLEFLKPIASLSLGATRQFCLKDRRNKVKEVLSLKTGDLLIMHPKCQKEWMHSVPARKRVLKQRINLTFRCYKNN